MVVRAAGMGGGCCGGLMWLFRLAWRGEAVYDKNIKVWDSKLNLILAMGDAWLENSLKNMNQLNCYRCVWPNPCSWQEGASAAQCAFDIPFISFDFFSTKSPSSLQYKKGIRKKSRKLTSTSSWSKETGRNSKSLEKRKKEKGFGSWLLRYQKEKQILGLAGSCVSLVNTYHTVCFI